MQKPNIVLDILNKRSIENNDIDILYRYMYNPEWYLLAYEKLAKNVKKVDIESIDGMSMKRINDIVEEMKFERYKWSKVQEVTTKKNSGFKSLVLVEWRDKLVQEVIYMILSAIYEPKFLEASHGYRPNRGVHTALTRIRQKGQACEYFIKGDISRCFESIDHTILLNILRKTIKDGRFIELIRKMLKAGKFGNDFEYDKTYSGVPIGGKLSPLLANIYLNELDQYIEDTIVKEYNREDKRPMNKLYNQIKSKIEYREKKLKTIIDNEQYELIKSDIKLLRKELRKVPSKASIEETSFRRLSYVRYADDWLITFTGTFNEAKEILSSIRIFLKDNLKLDLNDDKCRINKADKVPIRFLNYNIITQWDNNYIAHNNQRSLIGAIAFLIPNDVIIEKRKKYMKNNKPIHLAQCINNSVFDIIQTFQLEFKSFCQYYKFARNQQLLNTLKWIVRTSLAKTLSAKLKISVNKVFDKFKSTKTVDGYTYKVLSTKIISTNGKEYEAYFGAIPLKRQIACDNINIKDFKNIYYEKRTLLSQRLQNDICELCGSIENIEIHHIHHMKDIARNKSEWAKKMSAMNRKTLAVCHNCHVKIHNGSYNDRKLS